MDFFVNPEDLRGWIKNQDSYDVAASKILGLIGKDNEQDVMETCKSVYETEDQNATNVLFGILSKHNLTQIKTSSSDNNNTIKVAQNMPQSRQRNNWVRGERNKFNRVVDGFNEGTPWRMDRDKFYNFTHYYTDAISFDEDPSKVYSGEAIWRMYVMDKFTREYQNKEGKWVGGYINDRFYVFPTAGTPDNPDSPRDGGNQMGLAEGERSRKPRPHQYSTERRLEEARGNETYDIEALSSKTKVMVKSASLNKEVEQDKIYNIFKDVLDMREAGIKYDVMLEEVSKHYDASVLGVAQIDKFAQAIKSKHDGVSYETMRVASAPLNIQPNVTYVVTNPNGIMAMNGKVLPKDTDIIPTGKPNEFKIDFHPNGEEFGSSIMIDTSKLTSNDVIPGGGASEVGLSETPQVNQVNQINQIQNPVAQAPKNTSGVEPMEPTDNFQIDEVGGNKESLIK